MISPSSLRNQIAHGDFCFVPQILRQDVATKTLTTWIEWGASTLAELSDQSGVGGQVLNERGNGPAIVVALKDTEAAVRIGKHMTQETVVSIPRSLYGIPRDHAPARIAACLAAEVVWLAYADGIIAARDAAPASVGIDLRTFAGTMYVWAVEDHPASALALGAALDGQPEASSFPTFADLLRELLTPHLGGTFSELSHPQLPLMCDGAARELLGLLSGDRVPIITGPAVKGKLLRRVRDQLPGAIGAQAPDHVANFERAVAPLLVAAIQDPESQKQLELSLEHLLRSLRNDLA